MYKKYGKFLKDNLISSEFVVYTMLTIQSLLEEKLDVTLLQNEF